MTSETRIADAAMRIARLLHPLADVERARRVEMALTNDGHVVRDRVIGLITLIENHDQQLAEEIAGELTDILGTLNDPATGTFLYDAFNADDGTLLTAHTGNLGATWTSDGGAFTIHEGRIYGTQTGFVYASGESPIPDYKIEAEYHYFSDTGENGIALRIQPGATTGYFLYYNFGAFRLIRTVAGTETVLGTVPYSSANLPVTAGLAVSGDRLDVFVDGAGQLSITDPNPITAKGRAGLRARPVSSTTGVHFDNVRGSAYVIQMADLQTLKDTLEGVLDTKTDQQQVADAIAAELVDIASDQDLTDLNNAIQTSLNGKRDEGVDIPQSDVTNLVTDLTNVLNDLATKATDTDLTNLENALQSGIDQVSGDVTTLEERDRIQVMDTTDSTSTSSSSTIGNLTFSVAANTSYQLNAILDMFSVGDTGGGAFAGVKFGVTAPSGSTINVAISGYVSNTIPFFELVTSSGLAAPAWMFDAVPKRTNIDGRIDIGGSSGSITLIWAVPGVDDLAIMARGSSANLRRLD